MKAIIVHDREPVAAAISDICVGCGLLPDHVTCVSDASSARRAMRSTLYDIAIIDLTIANISGQDDPTYLVADQLLTEIYLLDDLKVPSDIIGITQDAATLERVSTSIATNVMTVVEETRDDDRWKERLGQKVRYTLRASSHRQMGTNAQYDYDLLLFTALDEELEPFRNRFDFSDSGIFPRTYTFGFVDKDHQGRRGIAFSIGKSGEARAASFAQSLFSLFRPRLALMTGICGGVPDKTNLGDIVFAESALDWDYGKWLESDVSSESTSGDRPSGPEPRFVSRPDPISIRGSRAHGAVRDLLAGKALEEPGFLRSIAEGSQGVIRSFASHLAPYGSGSSVISSGSILDQVRGLNDSIRGVDMECYGFYHAGVNTHVIKPELLCIKSVSDYSNGTKGDSHHQACSFASAKVGMLLAEEAWDFSRDS